LEWIRAKRVMERGQSVRRKRALPAMARDLSSKPPGRCVSMCRAIAAAERASCGHLVGRAAAKGACAARKQLTCESPRGWPTAGVCAFREKETREPWARLLGTCTCA